MKIGVITSGGDSPGMNPCIAQIVKYAAARNSVVMGYRFGYKGILKNDFIPLTIRETQGWYSLGGTMLRTSRMPELKEAETQKKLVANLEAAGIDALIVIGGDGSFRGALDLSRISSINFIGIPGTIDNNIYGNDYTLGFDTALNKQVTYIDDISDTAIAMPGRIFFVETLGAWDGYLAHSSVFMGMADFSVLVEKEITDQEIGEQITELLKKDNKDYILITFAEGTYRMFDTAKYITDHFGYKIKCNLLGFQQRGGTPTAQDRIHASGFAKYAVDAIHNNVKNKYVVFSRGKYGYLDLELAANKKHFDFFEI
jgi:6-phosphofructokinase 1